MRADDIWIHLAQPVTGLEGGRDHRAVGLWCMDGEQREEGGLSLPQQGGLVDRKGHQEASNGS